MSNFQIIFFSAFIFFIVLGTILFSGSKNSNNNNSITIGQVLIWGTFDAHVMDNLFYKISTENRGFETVKYQQKDPKNFNEQLAEALAEGKGPDIFLLPQSLIVRHKEKIYPIPYQSLPIRDFKDSFIEEGELFLSSSGVLALPIVVDPMVMYWNRDIFTNAKISTPPKLWDEFFGLSEILTERDGNYNIVRSAVAIGGFDNVSHAKDILSLMFMQSGDTIVKLVSTPTEKQKEKMVISLGDPWESQSIPAEASLRFFTEFSNNSKSVYSWNNSLPESKDTFLAGDLAVYFGFASEFANLKAKNPNLNFDVSLMPQVKDHKVDITYGNIQGFAISKNSKNIQGAFSVITILTSPKWADIFSKEINLPPTRRGLLSKLPTDPYQSVFYSSALSSRSWLDPDPIETDLIFRDMINSITSGKIKISGAISRATAEMKELIR